MTFLEAHHWNRRCHYCLTAYQCGSVINQIKTISLKKLNDLNVFFSFSMRKFNACWICIRNNLLFYSIIFVGLWIKWIDYVNSMVFDFLRFGRLFIKLSVIELWSNEAMSWRKICNLSCMHRKVASNKLMMRNDAKWKCSAHSILNKLAIHRLTVLYSIS